MASKEQIIKIGRIFLAGAALGAAACSVDQKNSTTTNIQDPVVRGHVLTDEEISQLRNYENFIATVSKVEPVTTPTTLIETLSTSESRPQKMEMMSSAQMTAEQVQLVEKYKAELPGILVKINADPQQIEDLNIYYPIYRAGQDKYGVPWELTWIIHEAESNASRNPNAFAANAPQYGAMQRDVQFHTNEDRDRANVGLEFLGSLQVRHFDDAAEIILADAELNEWAGSQRDFQKALNHYSARGPAAERYVRFQELEAMLGK